MKNISVFSFVTSQVDLKKREESCMSDTDVICRDIASRLCSQCIMDK